ncbi:hypothetical protein PsorP6_011559 [Peronosclerospora sorghi]|uniref:Uncharacterized protein n=1 Tax=Peronosclerospora sorghi TaxID=230839 RepID=A0ACC0WMA7_9STRA|nr:hypothetical protein PsorP6_011559 [Peronosclerospora sorghi]
MEGLDVYSTPLWHLKKDVELSYVRINLPLDSQHEASRRQTRVTGGCLLEMKQSLCLAHVVKYVTFSAEAKILVSDNRIKCLIEWVDVTERHKPIDLAHESATLVLKVRGVRKEGGRAASPLRKTVVLCRRGRAHFELADYVQELEAFDAFYRVEPHRMEGLDVYSTPLWHLKKDVELSYVRINLPLDS